MGKKDQTGSNSTEIYVQFYTEPKLKISSSAGKFGKEDFKVYVENGQLKFTGKGWIDKDISDSLIEKLNNNDLKNFINAVELHKGQHISPEAADYLLRDARSMY